jgi:hypothetical protein
MRKLFLLLFSGFICCTAYAQNADMDKVLSLFAQAEPGHSKAQYQTIVNIIHNCYPDVSALEIALSLGLTYKRMVLPELPSLGQYEYMKGLQVYLSSYQTGTTADAFKTDMALYITKLKMGQ